MANTNSQPPPRGKLSKEGRKWWRFYTENWELDDASLLILLAAMESFDRMREAQEIVSAQGIIVQDRFDQNKANPACHVERDSRQAMLRALKQLNLDVEPLRPGPGRPPGRGGNYG